jgi:hypothetical protein
MELERNNVAGAKLLLLRSAANAQPDPSNMTRSKAFLLLADLSFREKNYADAKRFYDSITQVNPDLADPAALDKLRNVLARIVEQQQILSRQDSLQRIAAMPEAEREAFIKKLVKKLRKQQGLKEDENAAGNTAGGPLFDDNKNVQPDLFNNNAKGEWYFYNTALKSKGFTEFKAKWGNRPNADNWRRVAAIKQPGQRNVADNGNVEGSGSADEGSGIISYEELLKKVPLTAEQMAVSNDSIEKAQFLLGKAYLEGLEDYPSAISTLEGFLEKFPNSTQRPEALFMLAYCYKKTGDMAKANAAQDELKQKYAGTKFENIVSHPDGLTADSLAKTDMTKRYDNIYNLFIEGNFDEALTQKRTADSLYGSHYWTPQLLYIQSVYFIKQRQDDSAKKSLNDIVRLYPSSPLSAKARALIDVLGRRQQIEDYLTKLQIERPVEDSTGALPDTTVVAAVPQQQPQQQPVVTKNEPVPPPVTTTVPPPVTTPVPPATTTLPPPRTDTTAKVVTQPDRKAQPPVTPPIVQRPPQPVVVNKDTVRTPTPVPTAPPAKPQVLSADAALPHYVVVILDKVDPVYINEARNAFTRYNREKFAANGYTVFNQPISDDVKLVLIGSFANSTAAIDYVEKTRKLAVSEIIPWLPAAKYSFAIITNNNLEVLKNTKDVEAFRKFLSQTYPGKL